MPLTSEQNRLFDIYERLFAEDGWKELVDDLKERRDSLKERLISDHRMTEKDLYMAQGMCNVYSYIIDLESITATAKRQTETTQEFQAEVLN